MDRRSVAVVSLSLALGCALGGPRDRGPVAFQRPPQPRGESPFPNWPVPPERAEQVLAQTPIADETLEVLSVKGAGAGVTGAHADEIHLVGQGLRLKVKWKTFPQGTLEGGNNSPRRELAAYAVQKLFLDPEDYVVPTSVARCSPLPIFGRFNPGAPASVEGTGCALGLVSLWLKDVEVPETLYDGDRFREDATYAYFMSNFNVLTYLIGHKDGRAGNFLTSKDPGRRQVFAVDNGIAFDIAYGGLWYNWFVPNWDRIRIPVVRKDTVDRLRGLGRDDLDDLGVLVQFRRRSDGMLETVPAGENLDPDRPVRIRDGTIQLGLKKDEIDAIWERIRDLLDEVEDGRIGTF